MDWTDWTQQFFDKNGQFLVGGVFALAVGWLTNRGARLNDSARIRHERNMKSEERRSNVVNELFDATRTAHTIAVQIDSRYILKTGSGYSQEDVDRLFAAVTMVRSLTAQFDDPTLVSAVDKFLSAIIEVVFKSRSDDQLDQRSARLADASREVWREIGRLSNFRHELAHESPG